jgi:hypothetical protein
VIFRGLVHDLSKFKPCEWFPYADYFYGVPAPTLEELQARYSSNNAKSYNWDKFRRTKESVKAAFDKAWLFHQRKNPHHWQFWILKYDDGDLIKIEMPEVYVKEMVADWVGASMAITGENKTAEWYEQNKNKIQLHPDTRMLVEKLVEELSK